MRTDLHPFQLAKLAGGLIAVIPATAHAQDSQILPMETPQTDMERYTAVRDRQQPGYEAPGIALGS